jgi:hypothetical protein
MVLTKKGQVIFYGFMLMVTVFILILALTYPVKEATTNARTNMNCSSSTLSDYDKAACTEIDLTLPYFIVGVLAIGGVMLGAKVIFS